MNQSSGKKFHIVVKNVQTGTTFVVNCTQESHTRYYTNSPEKYEVIARNEGWRGSDK